jgi:hypothetical protein
MNKRKNMNAKEMTPADVVAKCLDEGDPLATRDVPALALALLGASIAETNKTTDWLLDFHKAEAKRQRLRAEQAERDLDDVRELHAMLADPSCARALIRLIYRERNTSDWKDQKDEDYAATP